MKTLLATLAIAVLSVCAFGQTAPPPPNPATTQPNFTLSVSLLGNAGTTASTPGTDIGVALAAKVVFPKIPVGYYLRQDNILIPSQGKNGYLGNIQGLIPVIYKYFDQSRFQPYWVAGPAVWQVTTNNVTKQSLGYDAGAGINYDPTGTGKFSMNLFEIRKTNLGTMYSTTLKLGF